MNTCPLCSTELKLHLLQPTLMIISCRNTQCVYPFNLSITQLHEQDLIWSTNNEEIMRKMKQKFNQTEVNERIADFITYPDNDIPKI